MGGLSELRPGAGLLAGRADAGLVRAAATAWCRCATLRPAPRSSDSSATAPSCAGSLSHPTGAGLATGGDDRYDQTVGRARLRAVPVSSPQRVEGKPTGVRDETRPTVLDRDGVPRAGGLYAPWRPGPTIPTADQAPPKPDGPGACRGERCDGAGRTDRPPAGGQMGRGQGQPARPADDAEYLRRVYLDLVGKIPTAAEARDFLDDTTSGQAHAAGGSRCSTAPLI